MTFINPGVDWHKLGIFSHRPNVSNNQNKLSQFSHSV